MMGSNIRGLRWILLMKQLVCILTDDMNSGRQFLLAFFPLKDNVGVSDLYITGPRRTSVCIEHTYNGGEIHNAVVQPGQYQNAMALGLRVETGVELKGVMVTAADEISVMVSSMRPYSGDAFMAAPFTNASKEFILTTASHIADDAIFTVIAGEDVTAVEIYQGGIRGFVFLNAIVLDRLQTYTYRGSNEHIAFKVISTKPVAVQAGCIHSSIRGIGNADHMSMAIPPVTSLGFRHYVSPVRVRRNPGGYIVRIVASEKDTIITDLQLGQQLAVLMEAEYYELDPPPISSPEAAFLCSKPCMVAQYNLGSHYDKTVNTDPFVMSIPAAENMITEAIFTTPYYHDGTPLRNNMSIITYSWNTPYILIDGVTVSSLWTAFSDGSGMMHTTTAITDGVHVIKNNKSSCGFNAWMYGHPNTWMSLGASLGRAEISNIGSLTCGLPVRYCHKASGFLSPDPLEVILTRSRMECAAACTNNDLCLSTARNKISGECLMFSAQARRHLVTDINFDFHHRVRDMKCDEF